MSQSTSNGTNPSDNDSSCSNGDREVDDAINLPFHPVVFANAELESLTPSTVLEPHEEGSISTELCLAEWAEWHIDMGDVIYHTDSAMDAQAREEDIEPMQVFHGHLRPGDVECDLPPEDMELLEEPLQIDQIDQVDDLMEIDIIPGVVESCPEPDMNENRDNNPNLNEDTMPPPPNDVLTGQSRNLHKHPGNINLRNLAKATYDEYISVKGNPAETTLFYQRIQDTLNVRFWKEDGHGRWIHMKDPNEIHQIVASKFRSITRMRKRQNQMNEANGNRGRRRRARANVLQSR